MRRYTHHGKCLLWPAEVRNRHLYCICICNPGNKFQSPYIQIFPTCSGKKMLERLIAWINKRMNDRHKYSYPAIAHLTGLIQIIAQTKVFFTANIQIIFIFTLFGTKMVEFTYKWVHGNGASLRFLLEVNNALTPKTRASTFWKCTQFFIIEVQRVLFS